MLKNASCKLEKFKIYITSSTYVHQNNQTVFKPSCFGLENRITTLLLGALVNSTVYVYPRFIYCILISRWKYPRVLSSYSYIGPSVALIYPRPVSLYYSYQDNFPFPYRLDRLSGANMPNVSQLRLFR